PPLCSFCPPADDPSGLPKPGGPPCRSRAVRPAATDRSGLQRSSRQACAAGPSRPEFVEQRLNLPDPRIEKYVKHVQHRNPRQHIQAVGSHFPAAYPGEADPLLASVRELTQHAVYLVVLVQPQGADDFRKAPRFFRPEPLFEPFEGGVGILV